MATVIGFGAFLVVGHFLVAFSSAALRAASGGKQPVSGAIEPLLGALAGI